MREVRIVGSEERFLTEHDGIRTRHSFSFGAHYDPTNIGFGDLTAVNDEQLDPGCGYDMHRHRDAEIVTWVLDGALAHADSAGNAGTIAPGMIQRMSAGDGVEHSERNARTDARLRFVQMWLRSDGTDAMATYEHATIAESLEAGGWVLAVSGASDEEAAIDIATEGARLWIAWLAPGERAALPPAELRHAHLVRGAVCADGEHELEAGDVLRTLGDEHEIVARSPSEILVWAMRRSS